LTKFSPRDLPRYELIGLDIEVLQHSNPHKILLSGKVIDETKKTVVITNNEKRKRIEKKSGIFLLHIDGKKFEIEGKVLIGRPENRMKRKIKRSW
jgi:ribonuclease P protein subunit POP4